jgi:uncharacterized membrane protein
MAMIAIALVIGLLVGILLSPVIGLVAALIVAVWMLVKKSGSSESSNSEQPAPASAG